MPPSQSLCGTAEQGECQTLAHKLHQLEMPHSITQAAPLPVSSFSNLGVLSLTLFCDPACETKELHWYPLQTLAYDYKDYPYCNQKEFAVL